jgi:NAD(P) transhydrogenase
VQASYDYDLLVIGSGPAGQRAAIQAAKLGRRVAVVERRHMIGGVCANTGTIPSKTLREAILYLTGMSQRGLYGQSYRVREEITIEDLQWRIRQVVDREIDVIRDQLARNQVSLIGGEARLEGGHRVRVRRGRAEEMVVSGERIVVAVGTRPRRPREVAFDDRTIIDSDGILRLDRIPRSLVVVGAGIVGLEYASMFAALGTRVTVVEERPRLLPFCDAQMVEALAYHLRELGVVFRLGESVVGVERDELGTITLLASGKQIPAEVVLYSAGREAATDVLGLDTVGLQTDERGRLSVDETYRTEVEHIYAVGDVIGFPSLAATAMEQGRIAACCAFGEPCRPMARFVPYGIYSIPEISFVGATEEELTEAAVPYEVGISRWRELARGQILGDHHGLLKLLVSVGDHRILGVHAFGTGAAELVHVGQAVMALGGSVEYFLESVLNYPTLAESYKVAALDAMNRLRQVDRALTRAARSRPLSGKAA